MPRYRVNRERELRGPTELRIHGVGGERPDSMLDETAYLVAGNSTSGFYRTDPDSPNVRKRSIEVYSWGGLTSGGTFLEKLRKALWVLLLPYALVNAAGWMVSNPPPEQKKWTFKVFLVGLKRAFRQPRPFLVHSREAFIRLLGVWMTVAFGIWLAAVTIDLIALQCASVDACANGKSWLKWIATDGFASVQAHPGRLMVVGLVVPILGLLISWQAAYWSQKSSERMFHGKPGQSEDFSRADEELKAKTGAGETETALASEDLWGSPGRVAALTRLHLSAAVLGVAAVFAWTLQWMRSQAGLSASWWLVAVALVLFGVAVAMTTPSGPRSRKITRVVLTASLVTLAVVAFSGWVGGPEWAALPWSGHEAAIEIRSRFNAGFLVLAIIPIFLLLVVLLVSVLAAPYLGKPRVGKEPKVKYHSRWAPWAAATLGVMAGAPALAGGAIWLGDFVDGSSADAEYLIEVSPFYQAGAVGMLIVLAVMILAGLFYYVKGRLTAKPEAKSKVLAKPRRRLQRLLRVQYVGGRILEPAQRVADTETELWSDIWDTNVRRDTKAFQDDDPAARAEADSDTVKEAWRQHYGSKPWVEGIVKTRLTVRYIVERATVAAILGLVAALALGLWGAIDIWADVGFVSALTKYSIVVSTAKWAVVAVFLMVVSTMYRSYQDAEALRNVAKVWDILTFFPRWYQPFAPPSYASVALPQLRTHLIARHGGKDSKLVMAAHSQGTVIAVATIARLPEDTRERMSLLTFGSPVRSLYAWFFPRFFKQSEMRKIAKSLGGYPEERPGPRWINLRRCSDPIAGTIFTPEGREDCADLAHQAASIEPDGSRRFVNNVVDRIVPDPFPLWPSWGDPMPELKGHSYYDADPPYASALRELFERLKVDLVEVGLKDPDPDAAPSTGASEQPPRG